MEAGGHLGLYGSKDKKSSRKKESSLFSTHISLPVRKCVNEQCLPHGVGAV